MRTVNTPVQEARNLFLLRMRGTSCWAAWRILLKSEREGGGGEPEGADPFRDGLSLQLCARELSMRF